MKKVIRLLFVFLLIDTFYIKINADSTITCDYTNFTLTYDDSTKKVTSNIKKNDDGFIGIYSIKYLEGGKNPTNDFYYKNSDGTYNKNQLDCPYINCTKKGAGDGEYSLNATVVEESKYDNSSKNYCKLVTPKLAASTNDNITKSQLQSWGKKMADTKNYGAFCIYSYEKDCSNWNSSNCQRYIYAVGVPKTIDDNTSIEYYPIAKKGIFSNFYADNKMSSFDINSIANTPLCRIEKNISGGKKCDGTIQENVLFHINTNNITPKDFTTTKGLSCVNLDWNNGKMAVGSSSTPDIKDADKSANVYSYIDEEVSNELVVDEKDQIVCDYTIFELTYNAKNNTVNQRIYDRETYGTVNLVYLDKELDAEFYKNYDKSTGELSCPAINCTSWKNEDDIQIVTANIVHPNKYNEDNNICKLKSAGTSSSEKQDVETSGGNSIWSNPDLDIDGNVGTCSEILGPNLTKLVKALVRIVQIAGIIIVIVNAMISLIPAIVSKDQDGLKKATRKCVYMAVILVLLLLLGTIIRLIGMLFGFDTSCFI